MTRKLFEDYLSGIIDYADFKKDIKYILIPGYVPQSSLETELKMDISDFEWDEIPTERDFKIILKETYERNKRWLN